MTEYKDKWCQEAYNKGFKEGRDFEKEQLTNAKICLEQLVSEITVGELEVDPNILQQVENFLKDN